jgi:hypothetical protein
VFEGRLAQLGRAFPGCLAAIMMVAVQGAHIGVYSVSTVNGRVYVSPKAPDLICACAVGTNIRLRTSRYGIKNCGR